MQFIDTSSKWTIYMWDPVEEAKAFGVKQYWFVRHQGRFMNYYLCAN